MAVARLDQRTEQHDEVLIAPVAAEHEARHVLAWEQIEPGRFMPRRVRGSFRGGVLG